MGSGSKGNVKAADYYIKGRRKARTPRYAGDDGEGRWGRQGREVREDEIASITRI